MYGDRNNLLMWWQEKHTYSESLKSELQWMSENGTFGLANRTKFGSVFEHSAIERSVHLVHAKLDRFIYKFLYMKRSSLALKMNQMVWLSNVVRNPNDSTSERLLKAPKSKYSALGRLLYVFSMDFRHYNCSVFKQFGNSNS